MDTLWSMSTTIREAERIQGFLKTAIELEKELNIESSSISIEDEYNIDNIKLRIKEYRVYFS